MLLSWDGSERSVSATNWKRSWTDMCHMKWHESKKYLLALKTEQNPGKQNTLHLCVWRCDGWRARFTARLGCALPFVAPGGAVGEPTPPSYRHRLNTACFDVIYSLGLSGSTELQGKLCIVPIRYFWSSSSAALGSTSPGRHTISSTQGQPSTLLHEVRDPICRRWKLAASSQPAAGQMLQRSWGAEDEVRKSMARIPPYEHVLGWNALSCHARQCSEQGKVHCLETQHRASKGIPFPMYL